MPSGALRIRRALLSTHARAELPLLRLPTVLFPTQCCSLRLTPDAAVEEDVAIEAPKHLVDRSWREFGGRLAAFCGRSGTGVELNLVPLIKPDRSEACVRSGTMWKRVRECDVPTPTGVVHAVGGSRLRLVRSSLPHSTAEARPGDSWQLATVDVLDDEAISEARRERLRDEADRAAQLVTAGTQCGAFELVSSALDDELGAPVCDPRAHPLWAGQQVLPAEPAELSFWLAARLPLTTALRLRLLACACPLQRMRDVVDAMRLLLDPVHSRRFYDRLRVHVVTPCSRRHQPPRSFVGDAAPSQGRDQALFAHRR